MSSEMYTKYRAELSRLDAELAHYDRLWTQVPRVGWIALPATLAGCAWGVATAMLALVVSLALVGVRAYLIAMRKSEITWNRARLLEDLESSGRVDTGSTSAQQRPVCTWST